MLLLSAGLWGLSHVLLGIRGRMGCRMGQDHSEGGREGVSTDKLGLLGSGESHMGWWEVEALGGVERAQMRLEMFHDITGSHHI